MKRTLLLKEIPQNIYLSEEFPMEGFVNKNIEQRKINAYTPPKEKSNLRL
jgi:hypothetical protein